MSARAARKARWRALLPGLLLLLCVPPGQACAERGLFTIRYEYPAQTCRVTATCSLGGLIQPQGTVTRPAGEDLMIFFTPSPGYRLESVDVDGFRVYSAQSPEEPPAQYLFVRLLLDHTIHVEFSRVTRPTASPAPTTSPTLRPTPSPAITPTTPPSGGGGGVGVSAAPLATSASGDPSPTPSPADNLPPVEDYEIQLEGTGARTFGDTMQ